MIIIEMYVYTWYMLMCFHTAVPNHTLPRLCPSEGLRVDLSLLQCFASLPALFPLGITVANRGVRFGRKLRFVQLPARDWCHNCLASYGSSSVNHYVNHIKSVLNNRWMQGSELHSFTIFHVGDPYIPSHIFTAKDPQRSTSSRNRGASKISARSIADQGHSTGTGTCHEPLRIGQVMCLYFLKPSGRHCRCRSGRVKQP